MKKKKIGSKSVAQNLDKIVVLEIHAKSMQNTFNRIIQLEKLSQFCFSYVFTFHFDLQKKSWALFFIAKNTPLVISIRVSKIIGVTHRWSMKHLHVDGKANE